ncbi:pyruvate formate lyase family protein [Anatilimnocola floriformis]|uniref:pyruvate formate lyase family protein n=1 Tax=Anatilimnocola floriformis TaxID=2948575 RepID=UPI0020C5709F|nr:pyruvate formate lyase family protein [Anatilimnocola floriformis]
MHRNIIEYWQYLASLPTTHLDVPSPRVCRLLQRLFDRWTRGPVALSSDDLPHLFRDLVPAEAAKIACQPIAIRKALAVRLLLETVSSGRFCDEEGIFDIDADERIVGCPPPYSVGQGKELVRYLTVEEEREHGLNFLNEWSPFGHIVPNHQRVLERGLQAIVDECRERQKKITDDLATAEQSRHFYESVEITLQAVMDYAARLADLAGKEAARFSDDRRQNLLEVEQRLRHTPAQPPRTLLEAAQCLLLMHSVLHLTGEIVPLGRVDQLLGPFFERDCAAADLQGVARAEQQAAGQEVIDLLWIKLNAHVLLTNSHAEDRFTPHDGALPGSKMASNFDQGALLNQWMQQITIGGVKANDAEPAEDASNEITTFCLEAARRLPLVSPTLNLRLHHDSPRELIESAARTLLSGGAQPVLLSDERLIPPLHQGTGGNVALASARNYACDGCFETLYAGETEFSFGMILGLQLIEKSLNRGALLMGAGGAHLRGMKAAARTPAAGQIQNMEQFWQVLALHLEFDVHHYLHDVMKYYGEKERVCPSPLLSALINGCLESGRDLSAGGARYHLLSPLLVGASNVVDSLYAIDVLVFQRNRLTLEELLVCLRNNWGFGFDPQRPDTWQATPGLGLPALSPQRMAELRKEALALPRFGMGLPDVDAYGSRLISTYQAAITAVRNHPLYQSKLAELKARYDIAGQPFELLIAPGVGTFEQYVGLGAPCGASADGRLAGQPISSDFSAAPIPSDQPALAAENGKVVRHAREVPIRHALKTFADPAFQFLSDGAPVDMNVRENFPQAELEWVIREFAKGNAGNMLTITAGDPESFASARQRPHQYDLLRVRMGGWHENFIVLFPAHQDQHQRRPLYVPN